MRKLMEIFRIENALTIMIAITIVGVANSFTAPFLSLFGVQEVGMSPTAYGVFISTTTLAGVITSVYLGRLSDGYLSRKWVMLIAIVCAVIGFGLFTFVRNFYLLLLISAVFVGTEATVLPQLLAYSREAVDRSGYQKVPFAMNAFRMFFSLAWALGPAVGSVLLIQAGFTGLFSFASIGFAVSGVLVLIFFKHYSSAWPQQPAENDERQAAADDSYAKASQIANPEDPSDTVKVDGQLYENERDERDERNGYNESNDWDECNDGDEPGEHIWQKDLKTQEKQKGQQGRREQQMSHASHEHRQEEHSSPRHKGATEKVNLRQFLTQPKMMAVFTAFTLMSTAQSMIAITMPLYVTMTLGESDVMVGVLFSVAAALEIPLMLIMGGLAAKADNLKIILAGCVVCFTYLLSVGLTTSAWQIIPLQILTAITVSVVMGIGITYFQDFIPGEPGTATTLYTNTMKVGTMLAGITAGLLGDYFGFRTVFFIGALLPAAAFFLLMLFGAQQPSSAKQAPQSP